MTASVGIGLAFVAMLSWGFGDFLIQRSTKKIGDWATLFVITLFGAVVLAPFVYKDILDLFLHKTGNLLILAGCSLVLLLAALLDFEALKRGKLAVIEPIWSFEIPAASFLAFFILGDKVNWLQITLIAFLIVGLCFVSFRERYLKKEFLMEKGVLIAFSAAFFMGAADFLLGWGSRVTDPLVANFVINVFMAVVAGAYLVARGRFLWTIRGIAANRGLLLVTSISDNVAWIAYAFAMSIVPIAVATGLSESSVIIAVLLGFFINREKLQPHQKIGLAAALVSAVALAAITG